MTRSDFQQTMRSIAKLNKDLDKLLKDLQDLSRHLGKELGSVVESGVTERLRAAQGVLDSFNRLASAMQDRVGEVASRVPGSGKAAPKKRSAAKRKTSTKSAHRGASKPSRKAAAKPARKTAPKKGKKSTGKRATKITPQSARKAVEATGGVKTRAAKKLGVSVPTLNKYLKMPVA